MKIIALLPVRNESWILRHSLACLSRFCDVILVADQGSTDDSPAICREFPKVALIEWTAGGGEAQLPQQGRWRLLDAARSYDGYNLLWCTDADEFPVPLSAQTVLAEHEGLARGTVIETQYVNLWKSVRRYRDDLSYYGPRLTAVAFVDDRAADYPRSADRLPLHEPRVPGEHTRPTVRLTTLPVLHAQYAFWNRNQMKQAWYRCIEWIDGRKSAVDINAFYAVTLGEVYVRTADAPDAWLGELTFPPPSADDQPSWHEEAMRSWFDERGAEFFEPLEIWHVPTLRQEFRRRVGRMPRPDRSYRAAWTVRAQSLGKRVFNAAKRRALP